MFLQCIVTLEVCVDNSWVFFSYSLTSLFRIPAEVCFSCGVTGVGVMLMCSHFESWPDYWFSWLRHFVFFSQFLETKFNVAPRLSYKYMFSNHFRSVILLLCYHLTVLRLKYWQKQEINHKINLIWRYVCHLEMNTGELQPFSSATKKNLTWALRLQNNLKNYNT